MRPPMFAVPRIATQRDQISNLSETGLRFALALGRNRERWLLSP